MITVGFNPATYTVTESAGSVNVTVNILDGTLARDVHVLLMTSLTDSTATGIEQKNNNTKCCESFVYVIFYEIFLNCTFSNGGLHSHK